MRTVVIITLTLFCFTYDGYAQDVSSNLELADILAGIANHNKSNLEAIMTLQGNVDVESRRYLNGDLVGVQKTNIIFAVDKKRDWRVSLNMRYENWEIVDGQKKLSPCDIDGFLLKDEEACWYYAANPNVGNPEVDPLNHASVKGTIRLDKRDRSQHDISNSISNFDPFRWIVPRGSHAPFEQMELYAKYLRTEPPPFPYSVSKDGDFVTVLSEIRRGSTLFTNKFVFDVPKSYSLVARQSSIGDRLGQDWKCNLTKVDGIWFPSSVTIITSNGNNVAELKFSEIKINQTIPDEVFTLHFLGVRQQDHIYDTRTKIASEVIDPSFPLPVHLETLERKPSPVRWILITMGLLMIFWACWLKFLQWK